MKTILTLLVILLAGLLSAATMISGNNGARVEEVKADQTEIARKPGSIKLFEMVDQNQF